MNRETSLYLDAVRFAAAFVVFLDHLSSGRLTGGFLWPVANFGHEAVVVFFVLSGFVIAFATDTRETSLESYALSRAARIYSVALPALIATFILDAAGRAAKPDLYPADWGFETYGLATQFLSGLTFTNQLWSMSIKPGSMIAYWSLGYEVWYYVIFAAAVFSPPRWRAVATAVPLLIAGPAIAVMFPLWLFGVWAYHAAKRSPLPRWLGFTLFVASILLWIGYEAYAWRYGRLLIDDPGGLKRHELPQDYVIGLLFTANLIGFQSVSDILGRPLRRAGKPIRWLAGATFTLYLFHECIGHFVRSLMPWPAESAWNRAAVSSLTLVLIFAVAQVTERRKDAWKDALAAIASRLRARA